MLEVANLPRKGLVALVAIEFGVRFPFLVFRMRIVDFQGFSERGQLVSLFRSGGLSRV